MSMMAAFLVTVSLVPQADVELLFFTSASCPPCRQMDPLVDHLQREGYPIHKIDVVQQPEVSDRYGIRQTPTFVLVRQGQPIDSLVGATSVQGLQQLFRQAGFDPTQSNRNQAISADANQQYTSSSQQLVSTPSNRSMTRSAAVSEATGPGAGQIDHQAMQEVGAVTPAMERAMLASVRIRVAEEGGSGVGSGTVIHQRGNEALVLTCGHLFRESHGRGKITVEYGFPSRPRVVEGRLLGFEADRHDTALVVVRVEEQLVTVPVALPDYRPLEGDQVFSVGCDRGADPTVRESNVKALTLYSDVLKYDVHGRPIDGRSGGGLFTAGGQLIGVCNAAAVDIDEGLYAGVPSLHRQFQETGLSTVFADPQRLPKSLPTRPEREQFVQAEPERSIQRDDPYRASAPANRSVTPSIVANEVGRTLSNGDVRSFDASVPRSTALDDGLEIIVLVRSTQDPSQMETRVIRNPSPELLESLRSMGAVTQTSRGQVLSPAYAEAPATRMGRVPQTRVREDRNSGDWNTITPPNDGPSYRAQSPNY